MASYNRGFAIVGVQYILLAFVLNQSLGIFMNFGAKTPHHRKAPNRYQQFCQKTRKNEDRNLEFRKTKTL